MNQSGGRSAQKGFLYQNSLAAQCLFELLAGVDRINAVTVEASTAVDDIRVEREEKPDRYYQVKCLQATGEWTVNKLLIHGILQAFVTQFDDCNEYCDLYLVSPVPRGTVAQLSNLAKSEKSLPEFIASIGTKKSSQAWTSLVKTLKGEDKSFRFLRCYTEEQVPDSLDSIQQLCLGKYNFSYYASIPSIWHHLRDIATICASQSTRITRPLLLNLLESRLSFGNSDTHNETDIRSTRYAAGPEWYVHRPQESRFLSDFNEFLSGKTRNVLVVGDGGTGKSSFFRWMERELSQCKAVTPLLLSAEGGDPIQLLKAVNQGIHAEIGSPQIPPAVSVSETSIFRWILEFAQSSNKRFVVAVDHFESFFSSMSVLVSRDKIAQARYSILPAISQTVAYGNVMWVLFARAEHFFLMFPNKTSLDEAGMSYFRLEDFTLDEAELLLSKLEIIARKKLDQAGRRLFAKEAPRNPLKFILSFLNLCSLSEADLIDAETILEQQPWEDVFQQDFLTLDDIEKNVAHMLASLMVSTSRKAFERQEVLIEIEKCITPKPSYEDVDDALHRMQDEKRLIRQPLAGMYSLYHENFARYVMSRMGGIAQTEESRKRFKDFTTTFLHQTKGPMHAMLTYVRELKIAIEEEPCKKSVSHVKEICEHLDGLIRSQMLQLRSAEALAFPDRLQDISERISLSQVIKEVCLVYERRASEQQITISVTLPPQDMFVWGSDALVSTLFGNVIDNACKYSYRNREVRVHAKNMRDKWLVEILNYGVGISSDELKNIFKAYTRGRASVRARATGTGVGLYVARNIIKSMGGDIEIKSHETKGHARFEGDNYVTIVSIWFPKYIENQKIFETD